VPSSIHLHLGPRRCGLVALAGLALTLLAACSGTGVASSGAAGTLVAGGQSGPSGATAQVARPSFALKPPTATPLFSAPAQPAGDGTTVTLHTEKGDIVIAIYNESAPVAAQNFVNLASAGFYDGVVFHRIVPGFVIQGGDPTGTGTGGPGYSFPDEPFAGSYTLGTVAMANAGPNTNGSQFFIVIGNNVQLPPDYTIFGTVTSGMDVAQQIASGPRGGPQGDQALQPVKILSTSVTRP
jgi:cyclophilin family peptidyl-prolyl cis-trans isomerase